MTEQTVPRVYSHAERMRVITGILACILLVALDQTVVLPAIPQMAASLHGVSHISWVVSAFLLTTTATTPIYGRLSDQLGRRRVLAPALVVFLLACVVCAMADSLPILILGRALQGLGGGALAAVSQAAVADVVPPRERGRYQAWFASTWALSSVAGPVIGGFIAQHFSWRWIFWANLPLGALALVLSYRGLAGLKPAGAHGRIDYLGAALLMGSVGALLLGVSAGGVDFPWMSVREIGIFAVAACGFALLTVQQRLAPVPLLPGAVLARMRGIAAVGFLNTAAMFMGIFLLPLLLQWFYGETPSQAGLKLVPFLFAATVGAFAAGQVTRSTGLVRPVLATGLFVAACGFVSLGLVPHAPSLAYPVGFSALSGLGLGAMMPTTLVAVQSLAGPGEIGATTGILLLLRAMGGAFGVTLAGSVLALARHDALAGFRWGFLGAAGLLLVALVVALRMRDINLSGTGEARHQLAEEHA
jgi:EmrB/QacA subfamily drug resistance transporter